MKKFGFYSKLNTKEPLGLVEAESMEEAIIQASKIKDLPLCEFLKIFVVKEYKK